MGIRINPFTGFFDLTGSGGAGSPASRSITSNNATTDWAGPSGGEYSITILAATHGKGTSPSVQVFELVTGIYNQVNPSINVNGSGDVIVSVTSSPDNRFAGKILII